MEKKKEQNEEMRKKQDKIMNTLQNLMKKKNVLCYHLMMMIF